MGIVKEGREITPPPAQKIGAKRYAGGDSCDSAARRQRMAMRTATPAST